MIRLEILLFKLYYKIPFISYQRKRRFILFIHYYFNFLTKNTQSYQIHQIKNQINLPPQDEICFNNSYLKWIKKYDSYTQDEYKIWKKSFEQYLSKPLISIVIILDETKERKLRATIDSILEQIYINWEIYIIEDFKLQDDSKNLIKEYIERESRIKSLTNSNDKGTWSETFNKYMNEITSEFIAFIDAGDTLERHALAWIALDIINYPKTVILYPDEDSIDKNGIRKNPWFKPDWNPDLFLSYPDNIIGNFGIYKLSMVRQANGFYGEYDLAQKFDLALRLIETIESDQIRHIPRILYHRYDKNSNKNINKNRINEILKAVNNHLTRKEIQALAASTSDGLYIRVKYFLPRKLPLITLIIPTYNQFNLLHQCINSIIEKTDYQNYEITIINNNSDDSKTCQYLQDLNNLPRINVMDYPHPFNYSAINNLAVNFAHGELIGFINNDIEVINGEWLSEMVSHALRPEIAAVGARLWYKDDTLQHGGVILGIGGAANHAHKGVPRRDHGYFGRAVLTQNFSAVTGACLVMRKDLFIGVGGFNEKKLAVSFNDIDLCLKLIKLGLKIVWTPYANLYHHESVSRGYDDTFEKIARSQEEIAYMHQQWKELLMADPAYNPNLTLESEDFKLAWPPRIKRMPENLA